PDRRLRAPLGQATLQDDRSEAFCYRCHSKATDAIGGTVKPAANADWYGAVTNMSAASQDVYAQMQKGTPGTAPGAPTTTTNTLYFKPGTEETPPGTLPTAHLSTTDTFAGGTFVARSMSPNASTAAYETRETATFNVATGTQNWRRVSFVSPTVATAFTTTAAAWTINVYDRESSTNANARVRYAIYTIDSAGALKSSIVARANFGTEMGTTAAPGAQQAVATAAGTAVAVAAGDRIVVDLEVQTLSVTTAVTGGSIAYYFGSGAPSHVIMPNAVTFNYLDTVGTPAVGRHDVGTYSGVHRPNPGEETRGYIAANKHVECEDCHNPHAAQPGLHVTTAPYTVTAGQTLYLRNTAAINAVPPVKPGAYQYSSGTYSTNTFNQRDMAPASGATGATTVISTGNLATRYDRGVQFVSPQLDNTVTIPSGSTFTLTLRESRVTGTSTDYTRFTVYKWSGGTATPFNTSAAPGNFAQNATAIGTTATNRATTFTTNQAVTLNPGDAIVADVEYYHQTGTTALDVTYAYGAFATDGGQLALPAGTYNWRTGGGAKTSRFAPVLTGATGVQVTTWGTTNWSGVTTWNPSTTTAPLVTATAEWQICFKCHSSANGSLATWNGTWTDLALEFNQANQSYHPVVGPLPATDPGVNGSNRLAASQLIGTDRTWTPGETMTCTDCHNADAASPAAQGPHGSAIRYMLAGTNKAWPFTVAGATSGTLFNISTADTGVGGVNGLFCRNCHPSPQTGTDTNNFHSNADVRGGQHGANVIMNCVRCHIRVPHGGKVSRLMVTTLAPARYQVSGEAPNLDNFMKGANKDGYGTISSFFDSTCGTHNATLTTPEAW
ncbi:MAG TPA: hypothetical protein VFL83_00870, partial [Anaeromyxobacter sp.]|nr:hypothetical protein [Anaeromyxobacter sp.]